MDFKNKNEKDIETKQEKKRCISFGYLSKKMLIPLLIPILYSIRHYTLDEFDQKLKDENSEEKKQSVFINTLLLCITYSLDFFLLIYVNWKSKSKYKMTQENKFNNQLIIEREKMEKRQKKNTILYLILLSFFNYLIFFIYDIFGMFKPSGYNKNYFYALSIPVYLIITALFSFIFLGYKFYRHQKLAMIVSPILGLSLLLIIGAYSEDDNIDGSYILFIIECLILRSSRFIIVVFGKVIMEKMFVNQFKLMTYLGLFGILFIIISSGISYLITFNIKEIKSDYLVTMDNGSFRLKNIFDSWGNFSTTNTIILIITLVVWSIENNLIWFSIYEFSPNHYTVYASITTIFILFFDIYKKGKSYIILISSIFALCSIFICGLIFNEIIIIGMCKMDKNTNVEINRRQKEETESSIIRFNYELPDASFDTESSCSEDKDKVERVQTATSF
jgi:hypothetical protein